MTLREQLNVKVKEGNAQLLKEEIEALFLNADVRKLKKGITINLFENGDKTISYAIKENGNIVETFKEKYDCQTVSDVIPLLEKEGIKVQGYIFADRQVTLQYIPY